jgi:NDP-4-keto-2,6-dideoxyhexose 3-C-methyltransferase
MKCRIEKNDDLIKLFSLGNIYVSDFIPMESNADEAAKTPLSLCLSTKSGLVQLEDTADFDKMYKRYWYHSGTNKTMTDELHGLVRNIQSLVKLQSDDVWIDIGCNDGTLLSAVPKFIFSVGFDPAENNCQKAYDHANIIINDYFTYKAYEEKVNKQAKVITSIAMFYDLPDPIKFCEDIYKSLDDNGLWVVQMSYLPLMLDQLAFDNICHEHLEYYSLETMKYLLDKTNFKIVDCQLNDINGGSFRIYIQKNIADPTLFGTSPYRDVCNFRVQATLNNEKLYDLKNPDTYLNWYKKLLKLKEQTVSFIKTEVAAGKSVWAYGASTKGNTLLQYFGLDHTLIKGIAERQPQKYGHKTVGTNIPIYSEEYVRAQKPDYMLVLPWHFINEFCQRESNYLYNGGKFIVPCPRFEVITK